MLLGTVIGSVNQYILQSIKERAGLLCMCLYNREQGVIGPCAGLAFIGNVCERLGKVWTQVKFPVVIKDGA